MMKLLVGLLIILTLWILLGRRCGGRRDNFSPQNCTTIPTPGPKDCAGWLNYLSAGIQTIPARGTKAGELIGNADMWNVCSMDQIKDIEANVYAYDFAQTGLGPFNLGVNTMVQISENNPAMRKDDYCRLAKVITTRPLNNCQDADYIDNYMAKITPATQATLNKWLTYC